MCKDEQVSQGTWGCQDPQRVICEDVRIQADPVVRVLGTLRGLHSSASEGGNRQRSCEEMKGRASQDWIQRPNGGKIPLKIRLPAGSAGSC